MTIVRCFRGLFLTELGQFFARGSAAFHGHSHLTGERIGECSKESRGDPSTTKGFSVFQVILVGYISPFNFATYKTTLYITTDAGSTFLRAVCPFVIDASSLLFDPANSQRYLSTLCLNKNFVLCKQWYVT